MAQEEAICYQYPHLYYSLLRAKDQGLYPIWPGKVLFTPYVYRNRDNLASGFEVNKSPTIGTCIITAAAPNMNSAYHAAHKFEHVQPEIERAMNLIFTGTVATKPDINVLILGTWGCGVFAPTIGKVEYIRLMAATFNKYAQAYGYLYDVVTFAIPRDLDEMNFNIFKSYITEQN